MEPGNTTWVPSVRVTVTVFLLGILLTVGAAAAPALTIARAQEQPADQFSGLPDLPSAAPVPADLPPAARSPEENPPAVPPASEGGAPEENPPAVPPASEGGAPEENPPAVPPASEGGAPIHEVAGQLVERTGDHPIPPRAATAGAPSAGTPDQPTATSQTSPLWLPLPARDSDHDCEGDCGGGGGLPPAREVRPLTDTGFNEAGQQAGGGPDPAGALDAGAQVQLPLGGGVQPHLASAADLIKGQPTRPLVPTAPAAAAGHDFTRASAPAPAAVPFAATVGMPQPFSFTPAQAAAVRPAVPGAPPSSGAATAPNGWAAPQGLGMVTFGGLPSSIAAGTFGGIAGLLPDTVTSLGSEALDGLAWLLGGGGPSAPGIPGAPGDGSGDQPPQAGQQDQPPQPGPTAEDAREALRRLGIEPTIENVRDMLAKAADVYPLMSPVIGFADGLIAPQPQQGEPGCVAPALDGPEDTDPDHRSVTGCITPEFRSKLVDEVWNKNIVGVLTSNPSLRDIASIPGNVSHVFVDEQDWAYALIGIPASVIAQQERLGFIGSLGYQLGSTIRGLGEYAMLDTKIFKNEWANDVATALVYGGIVYGTDWLVKPANKLFAAPFAPSRLRKLDLRSNYALNLTVQAAGTYLLDNATPWVENLYQAPVGRTASGQPIYTDQRAWNAWIVWQTFLIAGPAAAGMAFDAIKTGGNPRKAAKSATWALVGIGTQTFGSNAYTNEAPSGWMRDLTHAIHNAGRNYNELYNRPDPSSVWDLSRSRLMARAEGARLWWSAALGDELTDMSPETEAQIAAADALVAERSRQLADLEDADTAWDHWNKLAANVGRVGPAITRFEDVVFDEWSPIGWHETPAQAEWDAMWREWRELRAGIGDSLGGLASAEAWGFGGEGDGGDGEEPVITPTPAPPPPAPTATPARPTPAQGPVPWVPPPSRP